MKASCIRPLAICLFRQGDRILVAECYDPAKQEVFYRPLGGGIEFGELSRDTLARELREEIGAKITALRYLGTVENVFTYDGQPGHEIVLVYDGELVDHSLYERPWLEGHELEDNVPFFKALWKPLSDFQPGGDRLYPEGLPEMLARPLDRPGLLIFDLDGTLFQTETVTVPAVQRTFQEEGLAVPARETICSFFGRPTSDYHAWLLSLLPPERGDELVATIDRRELALVAETGALYPGVREALAALQAAVGQMAICSNGPHDYVERVLAVHGLADFFDVVRHRQSAADSKPGMVRELLQRLAGRPAIVVGDRWDDVEAAHQNGLWSIAASYGYGPAEELRAADAAAESPADLPSLVRALLQRPFHR